MSESERARSGAGAPNPAAGAPPAAGGDPSMEDILASIRRILAEEEGGPAAPASPVVAAGIADGVLQLDASMMLPDPVGASAPPPPDVPPAPTSLVPDPHVPASPGLGQFAPLQFENAMLPPNENLIGAEASAAAATSVGSLVRTLTAERTTQVYTGGPTIEDMVRAELRPLLKQWLDTNLPGMVERLVRTEIERVVGRAVP
jgi:cell pole-organizing protein PopZ